MKTTDNIEEDFKTYNYGKVTTTHVHKFIPDLYCEYDNLYLTFTYYISSASEDELTTGFRLIREIQNRHPQDISKDELALLMLKYSDI
jgi:hypothetical protein